MKTNYKKIAKLATLLVSSLLIATASVQAYQALMYMQGSITVGTRAVVWIKDGIEDPDDTVSVTIQGIEPQKQLTYRDIAFLKNKGASSRTVSSIKVTDTVGSTDFEICKLYIYSNSTEQNFTLVGSLDLKSSSEITDSITLEQNECLKFDLEVKTTSTSVSDGNFEVQVTYS